MPEVEQYASINAEAFRALVRDAALATGETEHDAGMIAEVLALQCRGITIQLSPSLSWSASGTEPRLLLSSPMESLAATDESIRAVAGLNCSLMQVLGCCVVFDADERAHAMTIVDRVTLQSGGLKAAAGQLATAVQTFMQSMDAALAASRSPNSTDA